MILEQFNNLEQFNDTERVIIRHIQDHTDELDKMTIRSLAAQTFTSTTTVNRFCNHICNGGFKEFKTQLLKEISAQNNDTKDINSDVPFSHTDSINQIGANITALMCNAVKSTEISLNYDNILQIVVHIMKCTRLFIFGKGDSYILGKEFQNRLMKLNIYAIMADDLDEAAYNVKNMTNKDFALFITYSSNHKSYNSYLSILREERIPTAIITAKPQSPLAKKANYVIQVPRNESDDEKISNFASITAMNYVLNVIYSGIFKYNYLSNIQNRLEKEKFVTSKMLDSSYF